MDKMQMMEKVHPHFSAIRKAKRKIGVSLAIMAIPVFMALYSLLVGDQPTNAIFIFAIITFVICAPIALIAARSQDKHNYLLEKIIEEQLIAEGKISKGEES